MLPDNHTQVTVGRICDTNTLTYCHSHSIPHVKVKYINFVDKSSISFLRFILNVWKITSPALMFIRVAMFNVWLIITSSSARLRNTRVPTRPPLQLLHHYLSPQDTTFCTPDQHQCCLILHGQCWSTGSLTQPSLSTYSHSSKSHGSPPSYITTWTNLWLN